MKAFLSVILLLGFNVFVWAVTPEELEELKKHAENGNTVAQYNLGVVYYHAKGVPMDDEESFKWHRKAAE